MHGGCEIDLVKTLSNLQGSPSEDKAMQDFVDPFARDCNKNLSNSKSVTTFALPPQGR